MSKNAKFDYNAMILCSDPAKTAGNTSRRVVMNFFSFSFPYESDKES